MNTSHNPATLHALKENHVVSLADEKLLLDPHQKVQLYLLVSETEISAALFSPKKNTFLALASVLAEDSAIHLPVETRLKQFIFENDLLKKAEIISGKVIFVSDEHTLLPASFFRKEDAEEVFNFNYPADNTGVVCSQKINCFDTQILYRVSETLLALSKELLPSSSIHHHASGLMENFYLQYKNQAGSVVWLHVRTGAIDLVVKEGRRLVLLNSFACKTPADVLYYTLYAYEQLQLNPEKEKLVVSGRVEQDSAVAHLLISYIRHVEFASRPSVAGYSYVFDAIPSHFYHDLFTQVLCES